MSSIDRADRANKPRCWRLIRNHRGRTGREAGAALRWSPPRSRRVAVQTQNATRKITRKMKPAKRSGRLGRRRAADLARRSSESRPVFRQRQWRRHRAEQGPPARLSDNVATTSHFIVSVRRQRGRDRTARAKEAEAHGERVASAGQRRHHVCAEAENPLRDTAGTGRAHRAAQEPTAAVQLKIENQSPRGGIAAPVYEISQESILIAVPMRRRCR